MVGNTEGLVGTGADLFDLTHKQCKIYRRKAVPSPVAFGIHPEHFDLRLAPPEPAALPTLEPAKTSIDQQREADRLLLTRFVPAAVLVSADLEVLQTRGQASHFLELPSGRASLNLLKMIKPGLLFEVQSAIEEGKKAGTPVRKENLQVESDGSFTTVSLEVIPFQTTPHSNQNLLIVFEDSREQRASRNKGAGPRAPEEQDAKDKLVARLKHELTALKEYQQSMIEALEASNEELQSANEEIQSGNEELQSTNEELQTSK